jgi:hypothetical protein
MEKQWELIPKPLIKIQKLCVFDHYSIASPISNETQRFSNCFAFR